MQVYSKYEYVAFCSGDKEIDIKLCNKCRKELEKNNMICEKVSVSFGDESGITNGLRAKEKEDE